MFDLPLHSWRGLLWCLSHLPHSPRRAFEAKVLFSIPIHTDFRFQRRLAQVRVSALLMEASSGTAFENSFEICRIIIAVTVYIIY